MARAPRVAGICYFKIDGEQLEAKGGIECPITTTKRETVEGLTGVAGYKETARTPYIKGNFVFGPDFPLAKLESGTDMTITAELANGKTYVLSGAYLVGDPAAKGDEGEVELEFNGVKGLWQ
jgi:hypothetical protein